MHCIHVLTSHGKKGGGAGVLLARYLYIALHGRYRGRVLPRNWVPRMVYTSVVVILALGCATDTFGWSGK